jgi:hypothetical protein
MSYPAKSYHIIENQKLLDISLVYKNNNFKFIPDEYIAFIKNLYKYNNTIFPYEIINNKLPNELYVYLSLQDYICKNGEIYLKDYKGRKTNFITNSFTKPYIEDEYNDNRYAISILYFPDVPKEIGKLEIIFSQLVNKPKHWTQSLFGNKFLYDKYIIKSGTVILINPYTNYKFFVDNKLTTEINIPIVEFVGSIQYPI